LLAVLARDGAVDAIDRTFGAVAETWIDKIAKPRNSSWRLQERRLEMHVLPKWRDRKIIEIRRCDVRDLIENIEGEALPNQVLTLVRTIFRFALSRDWIESSPAEGVAKPNVENTRDRVLNMEEVRRVWKASELLGYPFGHYVRLLLLTGQRRTEVAAMRWKAIDLEAATWTLSADETKSSRAHLVPLSPAVRAILSKVPQFGDYSLTTDGKSHMSGYAKVKRKLDEYIAADGGEPMEPWRFHDLRRTVATHLGRLRIREEVIGRLLNHAVQGVTAKVYALHHYEPEKREALDAWAFELVGEI
jgi:integrase